MVNNEWSLSWVTMALHCDVLFNDVTMVYSDHVITMDQSATLLPIDLNFQPTGFFKYQTLTVCYHICL